MAVKPIPEGFHTVTPYLMADNAERVIKLLEKGLDAKLMSRANLPNGKIMHAQLKIGDSMIMISDATVEHPSKPCMLYLYVPDVDKTFDRAVNAGATVIREPHNEFYGDRAGAIEDSSKNVWWFATHVEDVAHDEIEKRMKKAMKKM